MPAAVVEQLGDLPVANLRQLVQPIRHEGLEALLALLVEQVHLGDQLDELAPILGRRDLEAVACAAEAQAAEQPIDVADGRPQPLELPLELLDEGAHHQLIHQRSGLVVDHRALLLEGAFEVCAHVGQRLSAPILHRCRALVEGQAEAGGVLQVAHAAATVALQLGHQRRLGAFRGAAPILDGLEALELPPTLPHVDVVTKRLVAFERLIHERS